MLESALDHPEAVGVLVETVLLVCHLIMRATHVVVALLSGIITVESVTLVRIDLGKLLRHYRKACHVVRPKKLADRTRRQ